MKKIKPLFTFLFFILTSTIFVLSADLQVRVTVSKANIRLRPTIKSLVISQASQGAVLVSDGKVGKWYEVNLPPDESGVIVSGYIHQNIVEVIGKVKEVPKEKKLEEKKSPKSTSRKISGIKIKESQGFSVANRLSIGLLSNIMNFGVGPSVEYWATENLGIMGSIGAGWGLTSFTIRGSYLLNNTFFIAKVPIRTYLGIGYTKIKGQEASVPVVFEEIEVKTGGSGALIFVGLIQQATFLHKKVFLREEFSYSTFDVGTDIDYSSPIGGTRVSSGYRAFSFSFGIAYFF